jgi:putative transcriptional regulator
MTIGADIIEGLENALRHAKGDTNSTRTTIVEIPTIDLRALRLRLGLTQTLFATTYGFSVGAVRNWEQGIRRPERAARLLLAVIERNPEVVQQTLDDLASTAG